MKANLENATTHDGLHKFRKEDNFTSGIAILDRDTGRAIVDARIYHTGSRAYACIWVHGRDIYASGGAYAGGYGYHRASAALDSAIQRAGIKMDSEIAGVGDGAMQDACEAIARAATGKRKFFVYRAHG